MSNSPEAPEGSTATTMRTISGSSGSHLAPPAVDFTRYVVVAPLDSRIPPDDLSLEIVDVQTLADQVEVDYRIHSPGSRSRANETTPFHFRVLPKTDLPIRFLQVPQQP